MTVLVDDDDDDDDDDDSDDDDVDMDKAVVDEDKGCDMYCRSCIES
jgi:hypothetical protein